MKKKSLLILPVLLLALAACNKEEEVPEENTPEVPGTLVDDDEGEDQGDDQPKEPEIDERIEVTTSYGTLGDATYTNESDLTITDVKEDEPGHITYTLGGTASAMSSSQANEFWSGVAKAGDTYIVLTVKLQPEESVSVSSSDQDKGTSYEECGGEEKFILRISGSNEEGEITATSKDFKIIDSEGNIIVHTVDFSNVNKVAARVAVTEGTAYLDCPAVTYENENNLSMTSKTEDSSGNITYVLSGIASNMDETQATDYWPNTAAEDDGYIVLTLSLNSGETVNWVSPAGEKNVAYANMQRTGEEDMILRISGASCYGADANKTVVFTIGTVTHTVDFSNVVIHTHPPVLEETCAPACSLGIFDFAALESSDASTSHLTTTTGGTILSKAWKEPTCAEPTAYEAESSVWTLSAINDYVYPGANGNFINTSNDYWQFSYQCLQFGSSGNNGSLTLDFTGVEVSKVEIAALSWSGSSKLSVDGDAKDITQSALDTTVATPSTYTWDLGTNAINELETETVDSITISATNRVLVFSITIWATSTAE